MNNNNFKSSENSSEASNFSSSTTPGSSNVVNTLNQNSKEEVTSKEAERKTKEAEDKADKEKKEASKKSKQEQKKEDSEADMPPTPVLDQSLLNATPVSNVVSTMQSFARAEVTSEEAEQLTKNAEEARLKKVKEESDASLKEREDFIKENGKTPEGEVVENKDSKKKETK